MRNIQNALNEHFNFVLKQGFTTSDILGVFLYGSQNYNMATDDSDVDTIAIIIPSLKEAILNKKIFVKEYTLPNGEHCIVMDVRHYFTSMKKQNINFVEILFTDYNIINPDYKIIWDEYFVKYKESFARYDRKQCMLSTLYQAINCLNKNSNRKKTIANSLRFLDFINSYLDINISYKKCIQPENAKEYTKYKIFGGANKSTEEIYKELQDLLTYVLNQNIVELPPEIKEMLDNSIDNGIIHLIYKKENNIKV